MFINIFIVLILLTFKKMAVIKSSNLGEGELICKYFDNRFKNNKNVLGVSLGGTGTGKSYRDLRIAELWYKYHFKKEFPVKNICFGVLEAMKLLSGGELRKGEIIIFEEAGVNMGSLDFQNKVSRMFNYVLQSFRSMNIGILFNLPYLTMLNKQARMLLHFSMESAGVDPKQKKNYCKTKFHQVNQTTGVIYKKYLRTKVNGKIRKVKKMEYTLPSEYLWKAYERKKDFFLTTLTDKNVNELKKAEKDYNEKMKIKPLTQIQKEVYDLTWQGKNPQQIAEMRERNARSIYDSLKLILKKGYSLPKMKEFP
jgi:hypothetical protein